MQAKTIAGITVAVAGMLEAAVPADAQQTPVRGVGDLLGRVQTSRIQGRVEALSGAADAPLNDGARRIRSRHVDHDDLRLAEQYLVEALEPTGLSVRRIPFRYGGAEHTNIEATLTGNEAPDEIYLVTAHYDSTASNEAGWDPRSGDAPGADDDASGCALVLEAATVLAGADFRATVRFVLFSAEEVGLVGSDEYAQEAANAGEDIRAVLSMDPVGNTGTVIPDNLFFTFDATSLELAEHMEAVGARYRIGYPVIIVPGDSSLIKDDRSDHQSFWARGFHGLHGGTLPGATYHTLQDVAADVDYPFTAEATKAVIAYLAEAAGYRAPPDEEAPEDEGCACHGTQADERGGVLALLAMGFVAVAGGRGRRP